MTLIIKYSQLPGLLHNLKIDSYFSPEASYHTRKYGSVRKQISKQAKTLTKNPHNEKDISKTPTERATRLML